MQLKRYLSEGEDRTECLEYKGRYWCSLQYAYDLNSWGFCDEESCPPTGEKTSSFYTYIFRWVLTGRSKFSALMVNPGWPHFCHSIYYSAREPHVCQSAFTVVLNTSLFTPMGVDNGLCTRFVIFKIYLSFWNFLLLYNYYYFFSHESLVMVNHWNETFLRKISKLRAY